MPPRPSRSLGDMVHCADISLAAILGATDAASLFERTGESEGFRYAVAVDLIEAAVEGLVDSEGLSENVGERNDWVMVVDVMRVVLDEKESFLATEVEGCHLTSARRVDAGAGSKMNGEEQPVASRSVDTSVIDSSSSSVIVGSTETSSTHDGLRLPLLGSIDFEATTDPIAVATESSLLVSLCQKVPCSPVALSLPK